MLLSFSNRKLQKLCSSSREMQKALGSIRAKKLQQRLMELQAADHLGQIARVPPPRCHEMTGDRQGQLSVDLDHPYRLFFIPANNPVPLRDDNSLDWSAVTEIQIIGIDDPH